MRRAAPAVRLTYDDFLRFPDDGKRHELIEGVHYVTASPNLKHQTILGNLYLVIGSWLESHAVGRAFLAPFDVVFSNFDIVAPDLLFISAGKLDRVLTPANVRGAPDLVVEIASSSTRHRDETLKHRLYERSGVVEYWIVDPIDDCVFVYQLEAGRYQQAAELRRVNGDILRSPLLPGLAIPLARVFKNT